MVGPCTLDITPIHFTQDAYDYTHNSRLRLRSERYTAKPQAAKCRKRLSKYMYVY